MVKTPPYTIRVSARSRRVWLKVTPSDGLYVVIPQGFDPLQVPALVAKKSAWIQKALLKTGSEPRPAPFTGFPTTLPLRAVDECWKVEIRSSDKTLNLIVDEERHLLILRAENLKDSGAHDILRSFLRARAREALTEQTNNLAEEFGFRISRVTIRNQRSRWGSCSSKRNISLNLKLLFVEPEQLRYVLVHELCHTKQMNHSPKFWRLVERFEPDAHRLRKTLHDAWLRIPAWL